VDAVIILPPPQQVAAALLRLAGSWDFFGPGKPAVEDIAHKDIYADYHGHKGEHEFSRVNQNYVDHIENVSKYVQGGRHDFFPPHLRNTRGEPACKSRLSEACGTSRYHIISPQGDFLCGKVYFTA
jgi:hypothetical protein